MRWPQIGVLAFLLFMPIATKALEFGIEHDRCRGRLLLTGYFLPGQAAAKSQQKWLALLKDTSGQEILETVTIRLKGVPAGKHSDVEEEVTAYTSANNRIEKDIFLFRALPELKPGPVEALPVPRLLTPNVPLNLTLKCGANYKLIIVCPPSTTKGEYETVIASLVLQKDGLKQTLGKWPIEYRKGVMTPDPFNDVRLHWAGDLNGDGCLDLVIDLSHQYCSTIPALFLSSPAGSKSLVSKVAQFPYGC